MGSTLWLLSGLAVVAAPLPADTPRTVSGPPPRIVLIQKVDKAEMLVTTCEFETVPVTKEKTIQTNVGGRVVEEKIYYVEYAQLRKEIPFQMKGVMVYDTEGKVVGPDTYWQRLKVGAVVLLSADNKKVDPAYLKFARPETLILVPSPEKPGEPQPVVSERLPPPKSEPAPKGLNEKK